MKFIGHQGAGDLYVLERLGSRLARSLLECGGLVYPELRRAAAFEE